MNGEVPTPPCPEDAEAKKWRRLGMVLRAFLALLPLLWATYFLTMIRTSGFGFAYTRFEGPFVVVLMYAGIPAMLPFLGLRWQAVAAGTLGICLLAVVVSEGFGYAQEMQVKRQYGETPARNVAVVRWWPFEHHGIFYAPGHGWSGCD